MLSKEFFKKYVFPVATLTGGIIGVGIFSLPYVASRSGIGPTILYLIVLTFVAVLLNVIVGEIALKTPDFKRIPGFVGFHLGKWAKAISLTTAILGGFGVLLAFLIIGSDFFVNAMSPLVGGNYLSYVFLFFIVAMTFVYADIKAISKIELGSVLLLILTIIVIFIKGFSQIRFGNIIIQNPELYAQNLFFPYGPIIFSLWGVGLIPEVEEMVKENKKNIKKIIVTAVIIPAIIYLFFILLILSLEGRHTTESALVGLKNILGAPIFSMALFAGAVVVLNAFVSLGLILKKVFMYDLGVKKSHAIIIVCLVPLILFLLGLRSFLPIISFVGGFFIGIDGILILLMYKKIGGKNILIYPLSLVFLFGIIYEIIYFIK
jgi:amino acid permease